MIKKILTTEDLMTITTTKRITKTISLAALTLALLAGASAADAQDREGRWEFTLGTFYQLGTSIDGEGGSIAIEEAADALVPCCGLMVGQFSWRLCTDVRFACNSRRSPDRRSRMLFWVVLFWRPALGIAGNRRWCPRC